jgi:hypothetical protein
MTAQAPDRAFPFRGRPLPRTTIRSLHDSELEAELTIAAWAPGNRRSRRFEALLAERNARRLGVR